ncbi:uncharacterized protein [Diadema antillarum]|uniref:uncharacterized protein n=1 Tax=Diadema antillarum TaxID=105358 RepID=UPI003A84DD40
MEVQEVQIKREMDAEEGWMEMGIQVKQEDEGEEELRMRNMLIGQEEHAGREMESDNTEEQIRVKMEEDEDDEIQRHQQESRQLVQQGHELLASLQTLQQGLRDLQQQQPCTSSGGSNETLLTGLKVTHPPSVATKSDDLPRQNSSQTSGHMAASSPTSYASSGRTTRMITRRQKQLRQEREAATEMQSQGEEEEEEETDNDDEDEDWEVEVYEEEDEEEEEEWGGRKRQKRRFKKRQEQVHLHSFHSELLIK